MSALTALNVVRWWKRIRCASFVIFLSLSVYGPNAYGQGTSGTFPDPIGLIEFADLLKKNGVDYRDHYAAIEAVHIRYLESCLELREQQIQRFQDKIRDLSKAGSMPSRDETQKIMDTYFGLLKRSVALDQVLFDAVRNALPQSMHAGLAQALAIRDRTTWRRMELEHIEDADVPVLLQGLDWSAVTRASEMRMECDRALIEFDGRHGKLLREFVVASMKLAVAMAEALSGTLGLNEQNVGEIDEEQLKELMNAHEAAYNKVRLPLAQLSKAIRESSTRAYRAVWDILARHDVKFARKFRNAYLAVAYPQFDNGSGSGVEQTANSALRVKRLSDDQREAIRSIFAQWQGADDRMLDHIIVKENRRWFEENSVEDHTALNLLEAEIAANVSQRMHAGRNAQAAIFAIIGPDSAGIFEKIGTPEEAGLFLPENLSALDGAKEGALDVAVNDSKEGQLGLQSDALTLWNARRMDDAWMLRIAESLGSGANAKAILQSLKVDYWKEWDARIKPEVDQIEALTKKVTQVVAGEEWIPITALTEESEVDRWVARANETEKIRREIEDRFFVDVAGVVAEPNQAKIVQMLRVGRICGAHWSGLDSAFDDVEGGEENANAILAVTGVRLGASDCDKVSEVLAPKLGELQKSAQSMHDAVVAYWRILRMNEIGWSNFAKTNDQSRWGEFYLSMQKREESTKAIGLKAAKAKAALQRDAFDALIQVVPQSARKVVQGAYLREAYFHAYGQTESAAEGLAKACALSDLTESQRASLSVARDDFHAERDAAVESMIQQMKTGPVNESAIKSVEFDSEAQMQSILTVQAQIELMAKYAFARDAARDKLILRLKNVLNAEQLNKAGIK